MTSAADETTSGMEMEDIQLAVADGIVSGTEAATTQEPAIGGSAPRQGIQSLLAAAQEAQSLPSGHTVRTVGSISAGMGHEHFAMAQLAAAQEAQSLPSAAPAAPVQRQRRLQRRPFLSEPWLLLV